MTGRNIKNKLITGANFKDFDWNKAKMFYHIVKCGSFMKAARIAGTDQPTLSRQVQMLEKQVGCPLLVRKSGVGKLTLTRKGEELIAEIAPFFLRMKGFCGHNFVEVRGERKRKIRIVTSHAIGVYILNDLMAAYNKRNPHLVFEIISEDHEIDIILNDADIAIRPYEASIEGVHEEYLFTLQKKLYASKTYLDMYGEPTTVEELNNHQFLSYPISPDHSSVDYPYSDVAWVLKIGMPKGELRVPTFTSNSIECLVANTINSMGIMSGYEQMKIFRDPKLKVIIPNLKSDEIKEYFICPSYLKEDPEIIKIKAYLQKELIRKDNGQV